MKSRIETDKCHVHESTPFLGLCVQNGSPRDASSRWFTCGGPHSTFSISLWPKLGFVIGYQERLRITTESEELGPQAPKPKGHSAQNSEA